MDRISVIVPCYNEQDNVVDFCKECVRVFSKGDFDYDFVFVNDGSTDKTLKTLREIYSLGKLNMTIISFSRNFGKEAAIYAGLKNAKGDLVTVIDADLQQRPEVVMEMIGYLSEHKECDCVAAYQRERHESKLLKTFKGWFYGLSNKIMQTKLYPGASDFRTMRRQMVNAVLQLSEYHRFSKGIFSWVGFKTRYIEYENVERPAGTSSWSFWGLFKYSLEGIMAFSTAPLAVSSLLGIISCIIAFILMIITVIKTIAFGEDVAGYPTTICVIFLLSGLQLFCTGILGQYLAKTYLETKKRPIYIARETDDIYRNGKQENKNEDTSSGQ